MKVQVGKSMSMIDHFEIKSSILHLESELAKAQIAKLGDPENIDENNKDNSMKVVNKFKHVERGSQTKCLSKRDSETQTDAPPSANFSASVNHWIIYDEYMEYEKMIEEKEAKDKQEESNTLMKKTSLKKELSIEIEESANVMSDAVSEKMLSSAKILERMVNQNTYSDIAYDFRYWDDGSDDFKEIEGSLLPLWKFCYEQTKDLDVTSISWNPHYHDLFAVGFGSYNFYVQPEVGAICLFSLKNPSYPDYICGAPCGVMSVDFHPFHPHMLAAGLHDGNVAIYNLQKDRWAPRYVSDAQNGKHKDIVWQVVTILQEIMIFYHSYR